MTQGDRLLRAGSHEALGGGKGNPLQKVCLLLSEYAWSTFTTNLCLGVRAPRCCACCMSTG